MRFILRRGWNEALAGVLCGDAHHRIRLTLVDVEVGPRHIHIDVYVEVLAVCHVSPLPKTSSGFGLGLVDW